MSKDIQCPYCGEWEEINHDDGYGYSEDTMYEQDCGSCGKTFGFTTSISFYYEPHNVECKNDGKHDWRPTKTYPKFFTKMECSQCWEIRDLTEEERVHFDIPTMEEFLKE